MNWDWQKIKPLYKMKQYSVKTGEQMSTSKNKMWTVSQNISLNTCKTLKSAYV